MSRRAPVAGTQASVSRLEHLEPDELLALVVGRRWFSATGGTPESALLSTLVHGDDELELGLVEVRFADGDARTYLVALGHGGGEALEDLPALARLLALAGVDSPCASVRPAGTDQSNSAVVVDESVVLKVYRRIEPGPAVEAELLRGLEAFGSAPRLLGAIEHAAGGRRTTLAIATEYVPAAGDGWDLATAALAHGDAAWLPLRARLLGEVTGAMHAALAAAADCRDRTPRARPGRALRPRRRDRVGARRPRGRARRSTRRTAARTRP